MLHNKHKKYLKFENVKLTRISNISTTNI